jgi:hypothetical protein
MTHQTRVGDELLGRYRVERVLGKGSFGTTYAAVDTASGRHVAVKQLDLSRVDDWKAVELFEREASTLEQLDHPRIPAYIEFVPVRSEESGYLVQSLAPGRSLGDILENSGTFTDAQLEAIAEQTLDLLAYLASLNPPVVHRDIKPANLLLDEKDNVYLVDFGAVQDAASRSEEGGSTVAGTFGYMAPEQLHGQASPRSDMFALGMTLIHLASGRDPSTMARDGLKVRFRDEVDLPDEFVDFIDRLVEPNPDDRFTHPDEARSYLHEEVPVAGTVDGLIDDDDIAAMVERRERASALEKKRRRQRAEREAAEMESHIHVVRDNGVDLTVHPPRSWTDYLPAFGVVTFLIINPGVFIALHFFLGSAWPVIDEPTVDHTVWRWIIWAGTVVAAGIGGTIALRASPTHLRLTDDGHFLVHHGDPENPKAVGRVGQLTIVVERADESSPTGYALISAEDSGGEQMYANMIRGLSLSDLEAIDDAMGDVAHRGWNLDS